MRKLIFTTLALIWATLLVHADYYIAGTMNGWNAGSNDYKMSLVSGTIYSKTLSAQTAGSYEFKITVGSWDTSYGKDYIDNDQSNVTLSDQSGNVKFTLTTTSDVTIYFDAGSTKKIYVQATPVSVPSYTFTSGTTIYYDLTAYGSGANDKDEGWHENTSTIFSITLNSDWEVTASTKLFRSAASGWNDVTCSTLPTDGQNMIVSSDGSSAHWDTYVEPDPSSARNFDGSTPLYFNAGAVSWWCDGSAIQKATFTKADNSTEVVTGVVETGSIYTFTPSSGSYKSVAFSRHNPDGGAQWNATGQISLYGTEAYNYISSFSDGSSTVTWSTYVAPTNYTIYFKNTPGWSNVHIHLYNSNQTFGDNGVGGEAAAVNATMTQIGSTSFYQYEYSASTKYTKVCFTKEAQDNYGNFWDNECSWSDGLDFDNNLVLWIPNAGTSSSINNCTYYNSGTWSVYPPTEPGVAFSGVPANVYMGQAVTFAATSENVNNPTYTYYVKQGEGEYGSAVSSYTFATAGSYTVKVEVRENGAGEALATAEQAITCKKYSLMMNNHEYNNKGSEVAVCSTSDGTTFTATWDCPSAGTYYFYVTTNTSVSTNPENANCDYLNGNQTLSDGTDIQAWLYGAHTNYDHSYTLNAPRAGTYTFTLTLGDPNYFKCDYPAALTAEVNLDAMPTTAFTGDSWTLADYVGSVNVTQPEYTFYVKKGDAAYGAAVTSYTFSETGTYTVKAEVREQGASGAALDDVEKTVTVYAPLTLYFVNKEGWSNIHAYAYGDDGANANWPGETMTATGDQTAGHSYAVYSIRIAADRYTTAIFNNSNSGEGNQTGDMAINASTPYYYNGAWYATLAECDPAVLTTDFYLVGNVMGWDATAYRFMKATTDATTASTTYTINEYSNIDFKLKEGDAWRGATTSGVILTKDANTVTITNGEDGQNIGMTPYAAGDYVFTLDLTTHELTVTYPSGEAMPVPTNIYLACDVLNNWAEADANYKFSVSGDLATLEVDLEEKTDYAFKLVYNGSWYGANWNFNYYWNTDVTMIHEETQANLYSFKAGTYTFRYKISTSELTIVFPPTSATNVEISPFGYATLYSATAFDVPDGVAAYIITGYEGIKLSMTRIYRIPAETGVLLIGAPATYGFYEGDERYMGVDVTGNLFKGTVADEVINNDKIHYILSFDDSNVVGFYWPSGTGATNGVGSFTNTGGKAYLELGSQPAGVVARRGFPLVNETPTDFESIAPATPTQTKFIQNGQLLIRHDDRIYNAQGARVQ